MAADTFDAVDEEFFREGERLGDERAEDFSDLDAPPVKARGLALPARPPRPPGALAEGTPRPEIVSGSEDVSGIAPRPHRLRGWALAAAVVAGILAVGTVASLATPSSPAVAAVASAAPAVTPAPLVPPRVDAPAPPAAAFAPAPEPAAEPAATAAPEPRERLSSNQRRKRAEAAYARGRSAFMAGNYKQSIRHFRKAVDFDPKLAKSHRALGLAYQELGDRPRAVRAFRAYLRADPRAKDARAIQKRIAEAR